MPPRLTKDLDGDTLQHAQQLGRRPIRLCIQLVPLRPSKYSRRDARNESNAPEAGLQLLTAKVLQLGAVLQSKLPSHLLLVSGCSDSR
jgi:hypothetical protein